MPRCMGLLATIEHRGKPREFILGMADHLVRQRRGALNPQLFFIGRHTVTIAILKSSHLGAWGAQLEGLPEQPLQGLAFLSHAVSDTIDSKGHLEATAKGHVLWLTDGCEETWFWQDGKPTGFQESDQLRLDMSFLNWHERRLQPKQTVERKGQSRS
jgi:hypothetical protein